MNFKKDKQNSDKPLSKENAKIKYESILSAEETQPSDKFENLVEAKIRKAIADGEFNNLRNKGKPLDLSKYYETPSHLRLGYKILKNAGYLPEEVRLKKEMEIIKEKIRKTKTEKQKQKLMKDLAEISQQFNFLMENNRKYK